MDDRDAERRRQGRERSDEIADLQTRAYIARAHAAGVDFYEIGRRLGISAASARAYHRKTMERVVSMIPYGPNPRDRKAAPPPDPGEPTDDSPRGGTYTTYTGEVIDAPEDAELKRHILRLAKATLDPEEIAEALGISVQRCRNIIKTSLQGYNDDELSSADFERRRMILQLDDMIRGIYAPATGQTATGESRPVLLEAIDRMLKLLKQKAELMGLDQPRSTDLRAHLLRLAEQDGYDLEELEEVAAPILERYRIKLPGRARTR